MRLRLILSETFGGLRRNATMAASVVLVTFVSMLFVGSALLAQQQVTLIEEDIASQVEVDVYLCGEVDTTLVANCAGGGVTDEQESVITDVLENGVVSDYVVDIVRVSREEFYALLLDHDTIGVIASSSAEDFGPVLRIQLTDPSYFAYIEDAVGGLDGVADVTDQADAFAALFAVLRVLTIGSIALAAVMLLTAVLLITTTIRLSALSRRRETTIMRMVGASTFVIQLPFMLEGAIAAVLGALLAVVVIYAGVVMVVEEWMRDLVTWVDYISAPDVLMIAPWILLAAVLLAALTSFATLRRYTRA